MSFVLGLIFQDFINYWIKRILKTPRLSAQSEIILQFVIFILFYFIGLPVKFLFLFYLVHFSLFFSGKEFFPKSKFRLPIISAFFSPTDKQSEIGNFALYLRYWDQWFGTLDEKMDVKFNQLFYEKSRPIYKDTVGLYFEQLEQFGEDVQIVFEKNERRHLFDHALEDGTSAFESLINAKRSKTFSRDSKIPVFKKISAFSRFYFSLPYRPSFPKKREGESQLKSIYFNREESNLIKKNSKSIGFNGFILGAISKSFAPYLSKNKKQIWMIPVNMEGDKNHLSFIDLRFSDKESPKLIQGRLSTAIQGGMISAGEIAFNLLNIFGRLLFSLSCYMNKFYLRRTGVFSNLGQFESEEEAQVSFAPPVLSFCPISIGAITLNNKISLMIHIHSSADINLEDVTSKIREALLQDH